MRKVIITLLLIPFVFSCNNNNTDNKNDTEPQIVVDADNIYNEYNATDEELINEPNVYKKSYNEYYQSYSMDIYAPGLILNSYRKNSNSILLFPSGTFNSSYSTWKETGNQDLLYQTIERGTYQLRKINDTFKIKIESDFYTNNYIHTSGIYTYKVSPNYFLIDIESKSDSWY